MMTRPRSFVDGSAARSAALAGVVGVSVLASSVRAQIADFVEMIQLPVPGDSWVWLGAPTGEAGRVFAMEGGGTIRVLDVTRNASGAPVFTLRATPFLSQTPASPQARSVAFAPDFATSGKFYVASEWASPSRTELNEYTVSASDPNVADPASRRLIWNFPSLTFDHAFGSMHFAADGSLWIGMGDNFTSNNAQSLTSDYGKMLRIIPSGDAFPADANRNYTIPADAPLSDNGTNRREIWALGVRNPWRWSFDRWTGGVAGAEGDAWIFDVGGSNAGEVTRAIGTGGPLRNYGWPGIDGVTGTPPATNYVAPVFAIQRQNSQCSTSGGLRYRGSEIRPWRGRIFYSDACEGGLRTGRLDSTGTQLLDVQQLAPQLNVRGNTQSTAISIVSMVAEDGVGEMYVLQANRGASGTGRIYRLVPSSGQPALADVAGPNQSAGPDGQYSADDIITYLNWYFAGAAEADVAGPNQSTIVDQQLSADDIIAFLNAFFAGA